MDKAHLVEFIALEDTVLRLMVDGKGLEVNLAKQSARLARATPEQRANFEVSASGYGLHWPDVDEDLSIDGLLGIKHSRRVMPASTISKRNVARGKAAGRRSTL